MLQMGLLATVAAEAAGGPGRLRRLAVRFAGMVVPGDTVTFTAEPAGEGKLDVKTFNQRGEAGLTEGGAGVDAGRSRFRCRPRRRRSASSRTGSPRKRSGRWRRILTRPRNFPTRSSGRRTVWA